MGGVLFPVSCLQINAKIGYVGVLSWAYTFPVDVNSKEWVILLGCRQCLTF